jgi:hypothetical protein
VSVTVRRLVMLGVLLACGVACAATDPLAGVVLVDLSDRSWALDDLRGEPVLLVIADRTASQQAAAWGAWLAGRTTLLAPWRAPGKVAWLSVADLRRVPEYARASARERLREQGVARPSDEASRISPLLLDWRGVIAEGLQAERGAAVLILLARDHQPLLRVTGPPSESAVTEMVSAIARAARP